MVKYLLDKNKYRVFGTFRRKKISSYLPYKFSKNFRLFKEYKIDFSKNSIQLLNLVFKIKPKFIIDFASICMVNESWKNSEIYFQTNVLSKTKMIEYLSQSSFLKKYIWISCKTGVFLNLVFFALKIHIFFSLFSSHMYIAISFEYFLIKMP